MPTNDVQVSYVCSQIDANNVCVSWVEQAPSIVQMLALTTEQATGISQQILIIQALVLGAVLVISFVKNEINSRN